MLRKDAQSHLQWGIIIIVTFFILTFLTIGILHHLGSVSEREVCRLSIVAASNIQGVTGDPLLSLECEPMDREIKFEEVSKKEGVRWVLDEDKLKGEVAREIYNCAYMVNYRKMGNDEDPYSRFGGDNKYCLLCGEITFDDKIKQALNGGTIDKMTTWMATHHLPDEKDSFFKLTYGFDPTPEQLQKLESADHAKINPNIPYTVFWRLDKDAQSWGQLITTIGIGIGAAVAVTAVVACIAATVGACAGFVITAGAAASSTTLTLVATGLAASASTIGNTAGILIFTGSYRTFMEGDTGSISSDIILAPTAAITGKFPDDEEQYGKLADEYLCEIVVN